MKASDFKLFARAFLQLVEKKLEAQVTRYNLSGNVFRNFEGASACSGMSVSQVLLSHLCDKVCRLSHAQESEVTEHAIDVVGYTVLYVLWNGVRKKRKEVRK